MRETILAKADIDLREDDLCGRCKGMAAAVKESIKVKSAMLNLDFNYDFTQMRHSEEFIKLIKAANKLIKEGWSSEGEQ